MKKAISKAPTNDRIAAAEDNLHPPSKKTAVSAPSGVSRSALSATAGDARFEELKARLRYMVGQQTSRSWF